MASYSLNISYSVQFAPEISISTRIAACLRELLLKKIEFVEVGLEFCSLIHSMNCHIFLTYL